MVVLEGGYSVGLEKGLPVFMAGYLSGERFEVSVRPSFETLSIMERVKEILGSGGSSDKEKRKAASLKAPAFP